ncbi:MAG: sulfatase/phosphatase domain-containing protein, partial [Chloroflexota bacterium]
FDDLQDKPGYHQEWAAARSRGERREYATHPLYFGCNSFIDSEIGRVIDAVDRYVPDNTWIIYTSDHGEMRGAHGLYGKAAAVYEEIAHIPLIVRPPRAGFEEAAAVGTRVPTLASHIDVLPTMLELAGLDVPPALEGESLAPLLAGHAGDPERSVFVEFHRFAAQGDALGGFHPMRAVVKGRYKLAVHLHDTDELYDLESDPAELRNRIDDPQLAPVRDALHDEVLDWMYANRDPFRAPAWERRSWRQRRRLSFDGGWEGHRRGRDDGYAPPFTQQNPDALRQPS